MLGKGYDGLYKVPQWKKEGLLSEDRESPTIRSFKDRLSSLINPYQNLFVEYMIQKLSSSRPATGRPQLAKFSQVQSKISRHY